MGCYAAIFENKKKLSVWIAFVISRFTIIQEADGNIPWFRSNY